MFTGLSAIGSKVGVAIAVGRGQTDFHVKSLEEIRAEKKRRQGDRDGDKTIQPSEKKGELQD